MEIIAVTNRALCREDFLTRLCRLAEAGVDAILLREKDLSPAAYEALAQTCRDSLASYPVRLILHTHIDVLHRLDMRHLHLPFAALLSLPALPAEVRVGVSVHSMRQASQAENLGVCSLIAGHIFPTACKAMLAPRGLAFLREVCDCTSLPVYAIGGITSATLPGVRRAGAAGVCLMSEMMTCPDPASLLRAFREK